MNIVAKHTPGPWVALAVNLAGRRGANYPLAVYQHETQVRICTVIDDDLGERDPRVVADANLIAAAPDLLEVARLLVAAKADWLDVTYYMNDRGDSAPASLSLAIERARAAIAKAEGAQS